MYCLSEVAILASEERRNRLLAEAAQSRLLKTLQSVQAQAKGREPSWWQQRMDAVWRWLTQNTANQGASRQGNGVASRM